MNSGQKISNGRPYKITIQKLVPPVKDASGFENEDTWEEYYSNYASVNNLYGNERWMAAQIDSDKTVRFELRWHPALDRVEPKYYRLIYAGRIYTITFVDNVQYKNESVVIDALEVGPWDSQSNMQDSEASV